MPKKEIVEQPKENGGKILEQDEKVEQMFQKEIVGNQGKLKDPSAPKSEVEETPVLRFAESILNNSEVRIKQEEGKAVSNKLLTDQAGEGQLKNTLLKQPTTLNRSQ